MISRGRNRRGSAVVEFSLAGIASIFLLICTFHLALGMWNYHVLAEAVHETSRFLAVKGENCVKPGNSCAATVATVANKFKYYSIGIPGDQVVLTLTPETSGATTCSPVNSCLSNTTVWPPSSNGDNKLTKRITVSALYQFHSPLLFFWPGKGSVRFGQIWFPASSTQTILF